MTRFATQDTTHINKPWTYEIHEGCGSEVSSVKLRSSKFASHHAALMDPPRSMGKGVAYDLYGSATIDCTTEKVF